MLKCFKPFWVFLLGFLTAYLTLVFALWEPMLMLRERNVLIKQCEMLEKPQYGCTAEWLVKPASKGLVYRFSKESKLLIMEVDQ